MSGTAIVRALLVVSSDVQALVPASRVLVGVLPQATAVPALGITSIGDNEEPTLARKHNPLIRERVQVTAYAGDYPTLKRLLKAAGLGKGVHTGIVNGFKVRSVIPLGTNPEIPPGDDRIYEQSRDFMVTFVEAN